MDQKVQEYFLERDFNCAEAVLRILNSRYALGLTDGDYHLVSAFGGGGGCGLMCGALAGCLAAAGKIKVHDRAHTTPDFKSDCADLCRRFEESLGGTDCADLRPMHFQEGVRCSYILETALREFDNWMEK